MFKLVTMNINERLSVTTQKRECFRPVQRHQSQELAADTLFYAQRSNHKVNQSCLYELIDESSFIQAISANYKKPCKF